MHRKKEETPRVAPDRMGTVRVEKGTRRIYWDYFGEGGKEVGASDLPGATGCLLADGEGIFPGEIGGLCLSMTVAGIAGAG